MCMTGDSRNSGNTVEKCRQNPQVYWQCDRSHRGERGSHVKCISVHIIHCNLSVFRYGCDSSFSFSCSALTQSDESRLCGHQKQWNCNWNCYSWQTMMGMSEQALIRIRQHSVTSNNVSQRNQFSYSETIIKQRNVHACAIQICGLFGLKSKLFQPLFLCCWYLDFGLLSLLVLIRTNNRNSRDPPPPTAHIVYKSLKVFLEWMKSLAKINIMGRRENLVLEV